jgi:hypothetical protein
MSQDELGEPQRHEGVWAERFGDPYKDRKCP